MLFRSGHDVDIEMLVLELIDANLHWWRHDVIMENFCRKEADAIYKIPLS